MKLKNLALLRQTLSIKYHFTCNLYQDTTEVLNPSLPWLHYIIYDHPLKIFEIIYSQEAAIEVCKKQILETTENTDGRKDLVGRLIRLRIR